MSRYIDADALGIGKADRKAFEIPQYADGWNSAIEVIANAPTADVVEVVRCRDCKHFVDEDETDMLGLCTCKRIAIAYNGELYPERDFYCAYGERSENGT